jgi:hypothetical protein
MAFCIFTMMVSCGVFAFAVGEIGSIFKEFSALENDINLNLYIINTYMNSKNVS